MDQSFGISYHKIQKEYYKGIKEFISAHYKKQGNINYSYIKFRMKTPGQKL